MVKATQTDNQPAHRKLIVWHRAVDAAVEAYRIAGRLPRDERYELAQQIRTAAISILGNIAEGKGRSQRADFARFLSIARGSAYELDAYFELTRRLQYVKDSELMKAVEPLNEVGRMLTAMLRGLAPLRDPRSSP